MPYSGVPEGSETEKKIERCVEKVMREQKRDKSSAIAICRASIQGKKYKKQVISDVGSFVENYDPNAVKEPELVIEEEMEKDAPVQALSEEAKELIQNVIESKVVPLDVRLSFVESVLKFAKAPVQAIKEAVSGTYESGFVIQKDAQGNDRWIGWVSNNFRDRDKDIIIEAAHKDYINWLDQHPEMAPALLPWHTPIPYTHPVDFWAYEKGFVIMSGLLEEKEAQALEKISKETALGMSHGFFAKRSKENRNEIIEYRTFEVSVLPLDRAANPWTSFEALTN